MNSADITGKIIDAVPFYIYWKDASGKISGANRSILREHGLDHADELREKGLFQGRTAEFDKQVLETGRPLFQREIHLTSSRGKKRILSLNTIPLFDDEGRVSGVLGTCSDITESIQYRDQLRQRKDFLAGLVESLPVGFFAKDPSSGFSYRIWNRKMEEIFGYTADRAVDGRDWNLFGAASAELLEAHDRELLESADSGRKPRTYTLSGLNGLRTVSIVRVPLYDDLLDTTLVAGTVEDVTRENELEEQLHQAQKMEAVGRLAGGVAHDFNNLLQVMMGAAEIGSSSEEDPGKYFSQILMAGEKAMSLTRQLLSFSRHGSFNKKPFQVDRRIRDFTGMVGRIVEASMQLEFRPGAPGLSINGDPFQLEQVLMNLIVNARDALEGMESGSITVETSEEMIVCEAGKDPVRCVCISVSDTGPGIPEDVRSRIFEPFFTTKKQGKGTGLGLASSYAIAVKHGGTIKVESSPGEGSCFRVCIPLWLGEVSIQETETPVISDSQSSGKLTVLLAEDEDMVREIARVILEKAGHRVLEAVNGKEALEIYSSNAGSIQIAVFDAMMPEMNGRDAFEHILQQSPRLPCLFCTGYSGDSLMSYFEDRARVSVLQKPYSSSGLLAAIEELIGKN